MATTLLPLLSQRKMPPIPVNYLGVPPAEGVRAREGGAGEVPCVGGGEPLAAVSSLPQRSPRLSPVAGGGVGIGRSRAYLIPTRRSARCGGAGAAVAGPASWTAAGSHFAAAAATVAAGGELPPVTGRSGGSGGGGGHYLDSFPPAGLMAARVAAGKKPLADARHPCGHLTSDSRSISSASALSTLTTLPGTASAGRTPPSPHFLPAAQPSHTSFLATSSPARAAAGVVGAATAPDGEGGGGGGAGHRLGRAAVRPSSSAPASTMWAPRGPADDLSDDESEASVCSFSGGAVATVVPGGYGVAALCPTDELELDLWPAATEPHVWLPLEKQC